MSARHSFMDLNDFTNEFIINNTRTKQTDSASANDTIVTIDKIQQIEDVLNQYIKIHNKLRNKTLNHAITDLKVHSNTHQVIFDDSDCNISKRKLKRPRQEQHHPQLCQYQEHEQIKKDHEQIIQDHEAQHIVFVSNDNSNHNNLVNHNNHNDRNNRFKDDNHSHQSNIEDGVANDEDEKRQLLELWWKLRELAILPGGLCNDSIRQCAWPILLGIEKESEMSNVSIPIVENDNLFQRQLPQFNPLPSRHMDYDQIELDVRRNTWEHVLPLSSVSASVAWLLCDNNNKLTDHVITDRRQYTNSQEVKDTIESMDDTVDIRNNVDNVIQHRKHLLLSFINETLLLSIKSPLSTSFTRQHNGKKFEKNCNYGSHCNETTKTLRYYQGYHDFAAVILAVMIPTPLLEMASISIASTNVLPATMKKYHNENKMDRRKRNWSNYKNVDNHTETSICGFSTEIARSVLLHVSQNHLMDYMKIDFSTVRTTLQMTIFPIMYHVDRNLHDYLVNDCSMEPTEPFFAISWILTWFSHDILSKPTSSSYERYSHSDCAGGGTKGTKDVSKIDMIKRIFDFFLVSHPIMPLYMVIALILHPTNRNKLLVDGNLMENDFAEIHMMLSLLPHTLRMSTTIDIPTISTIEDTTTTDVFVSVEEVLALAVNIMSQIPPHQVVQIASQYYCKNPNDDSFNGVHSQHDTILHPIPSGKFIHTSNDVSMLPELISSQIHDISMLRPMKLVCHSSLDTSYGTIISDDYHQQQQDFVTDWSEYFSLTSSSTLIDEVEHMESEAQNQLDLQYENDNDYSLSERSRLMEDFAHLESSNKNKCISEKNNPNYQDSSRMHEIKVGQEKCHASVTCDKSNAQNRSLILRFVRKNPTAVVVVAAGFGCCTSQNNSAANSEVGNTRKKSDKAQRRLLLLITFAIIAVITWMAWKRKINRFIGFLSFNLFSNKNINHQYNFQPFDENDIDINMNRFVPISLSSVVGSNNKNRDNNNNIITADKSASGRPLLPITHNNNSPQSSWVTSTITAEARQLNSKDYEQDVPHINSVDDTCDSDDTVLQNNCNTNGKTILCDNPINKFSHDHSTIVPSQSHYANEEPTISLETYNSYQNDETNNMGKTHSLKQSSTQYFANILEKERSYLKSKNESKFVHRFRHWSRVAPSCTAACQVVDDTKKHTVVVTHIAENDARTVMALSHDDKQDDVKTQQDAYDIYLERYENLLDCYQSSSIICITTSDGESTMKWHLRPFIDNSIINCCCCRCQKTSKASSTYDENYLSKSHPSNPETKSESQVSSVNVDELNDTSNDKFPLHDIQKGSHSNTVLNPSGSVVTKKFLGDDSLNSSMIPLNGKDNHTLGKNGQLQAVALHKNELFEGCPSSDSLINDQLSFLASKTPTMDTLANPNDNKCDWMDQYSGLSRTLLPGFSIANDNSIIYSDDDVSPSLWLSYIESETNKQALKATEFKGFDSEQTLPEKRFGTTETNQSFVPFNHSLGTNTYQHPNPSNQTETGSNGITQESIALENDLMVSLPLLMIIESIKTSQVFHLSSIDIATKNDDMESFMDHKNYDWRGVQSFERDQSIIQPTESDDLRFCQVEEQELNDVLLHSSDYNCMIAGKPAQMLCLVDGSQFCRPYRSNGSIDLLDLSWDDIASLGPCNGTSIDYVQSTSTTNDLPIFCPIEYGSCGNIDETVIICHRGSNTYQSFQTSSDQNKRVNNEIVQIGDELCLPATKTTSNPTVLIVSDVVRNHLFLMHHQNPLHICGCCDGFDPDIDSAGKCVRESRSFNDQKSNFHKMKANSRDCLSSTNFSHLSSLSSEQEYTEALFFSKKLYNPCCHPCRSQVPTTYRPCCCFQSSSNNSQYDDRCDGDKLWELGFENCTKFN